MENDKTDSRFEDLLDSAAPSGAPEEELAQMMDRRVRNLDRLLNGQINAILHHPRFRNAEKTWQELRFLAEEVPSDSNVSLELLPMSLEELRADILETDNISEVGLFQQIRKGDHSAVVLGWEMGRGNEDTELVSRLVSVGGAAHVMFLVGASAGFFGMPSYRNLEKVADLRSKMDGPEYTKWNVLRDRDEARFLVLSAVGFALRYPRGWQEEEGALTGFREESWRGGGPATLWGNPAFGMASVLARAFQQSGEIMRLHGQEMGRVGAPLPAAVDRPSSKLSPLEVTLSNEKGLELAMRGINILSLAGENEPPCFLGAQTAMRPRTYQSRELTVLMLAYSRMAWALFACRIAAAARALHLHSNAGTTGELQRELAQWVEQNKATEEPPNGPFKSAKVEVGEEEETRGWWLAHFEIVPSRDWEEIGDAFHVDVWLPAQA